MGHGGDPTPLGAASASRAAGRAPIDPRDFLGFSYFLGQPEEKDRSALGTDPVAARRLLRALHTLLPVQSGTDNPRVPAGYTYLLQLVSHDLVDTTVPFWLAAEGDIPSRNMRASGLHLDTLYGGGPVACPFAFKPGLNARPQAQLLLGRVSDAPARGISGACAFRDLGRLRVDAAASGNNFGATELVLAADSRSDYGGVLTQLVVLFAILHNAIAARLSHLGPQAQFAHARTAMLHIYHQVIGRDLLPKLLHPKVLDRFNGREAASPEWLWKGEGVPLELTHGVLRACHAMVRPFYVMSDRAGALELSKLLNGPVWQSLRGALSSERVLSWSKFFDMGEVPNPSKRLELIGRSAVDGGLYLPEIGPDTPDNLSLRDWLSAGAARMWKVQALVAEVAARSSLPPSAFLGPDDVRQWLVSRTVAGPGNVGDRKIVEDNTELLSIDLPLPAYVLLEAQAQTGGTSLGMLGSLVLGDVLFRRLAEEEAAQRPALAAARSAFDEENWSQLTGIASMPALIRLAETWGGLSDCPQMPFIAASAS